MPKATVSTEGYRRELKSCPPDGYVVLRQLSFGQMLRRRDLAARYMQEMSGRNDPNEVSKIQIDILNEASRKYDFANCIMDHNLEDAQGNKLDFSNSMTLEVLDPRISAEIEREIDKLNLEDFNPENFTTPSGSSSTETGNPLQPVEDSDQLKTS